MLTISEIKRKVSKVGKKYGIKSAYLFGSYAKDAATEESDVDLFVEKGDVRTYRDYFHFCEDLRNELGTEVDVLTPEGIRPRFFELIKDDRILLYGVPGFEGILRGAN